MLNRNLFVRLCYQRQFQRYYGVRNAGDSPLDYLPKDIKRPFFNWKWIFGFVSLGSYLAYSEKILDAYAEFTALQEHNDLLPIQLQYKLTQLPIYQQIMHSKSELWIKLETWEDLNHNVLDKQVFGSNLNTGNKQLNGSDKKSSNVASNTLAKPGGFLIKPVIFYNTKTNEGIVIIHAGYRLSGYPFVIHGGIIASILNETFKRNAALNSFTSSNYKGDFKVENISINYKSPTLANQFLILKTKVINNEFEAKDLNSDQWIRLESSILLESGKLLVVSDALLHDTGFYSNSKKGIFNFGGK